MNMDPSRSVLDLRNTMLSLKTQGQDVVLVGKDWFVSFHWYFLKGVLWLRTQSLNLDATCPEDLQH